MKDRSRREFLAEVGRGMLVASVGAAASVELGLAPAQAAEGGAALKFGKLELLVGLMQDTPANQLLPLLVERLNNGTDLHTLLAAAALANARTFGGQDYVGYHSFMALAPASAMAQELPQERRALPVLKVLHRNTTRMQEVGGHKDEVLHQVSQIILPKDESPGEALRGAERTVQMETAERIFAHIMQGPLDEAYNHLQFVVEDEVDVHRVVLAWRAWAMLDLAGKEHAHTLLRQSVRYCVDTEARMNKSKYPHSGVRTTLPKLLDQYKLLGKTPGNRMADDTWVEKLAQTIYADGREKAAEAVAAALAEGMAPEAIAEAMSLAANRLVLCDPGRKQADGAQKPVGSVHGASVGVHASDSANAWRNIARVTNARNTFASLITGAYHTAGQNGGQNARPFPLPDQLEKVSTTDADKLLQLTEAAIKEKNQAEACTLVTKYGALGYPARPVFDLLLRFATSEDGALHAEKYYRTVTEEFAATRPAFRWRHLAGLARVTASEYGFPAPGYAEACRLLKV